MMMVVSAPPGSDWCWWRQVAGYTAACELVEASSGVAVHVRRFGGRWAWRRVEHHSGEVWTYIPPKWKVMAFLEPEQARLFRR